MKARRFLSSDLVVRKSFIQQSVSYGLLPYLVETTEAVLVLKGLKYLTFLQNRFIEKVLTAVLFYEVDVGFLWHRNIGFIFYCL